MAAGSGPTPEGKHFLNLIPGVKTALVLLDQLRFEGALAVSRDLDLHLAVALTRLVDNPLRGLSRFSEPRSPFS